MDLLTSNQIHQHASTLVREAGGRLIVGVWGGGVPAGQNNGVHLQLQVNIPGPIWAVPPKYILLTVPGTNICLTALQYFHFLLYQEYYKICKHIGNIRNQ